MFSSSFVKTLHTVAAVIDLGAANTIDNLQILCFECNGGKNNKDDTGFRYAGLPQTDK